MVSEAKRAVQNEKAGTYHLVGTRGCGAEPDGESVQWSWAVVRDTDESDHGDRCSK